MSTVITEEIKQTLLLSFHYKGQIRLVEPHAYGRQSDGQEALCAWQREGGSGEGYRHFLVSEISNLVLETQKFDGSRPKFRRGDRRFAAIIAEL